jgi:N-succinyldiaminopimelate aminotransferase
MKFEPYPFEKLNNLLAGISENIKYPITNLTIGEPQFPTPKFVQDEFIHSASLLNKYPATAGQEYLKNAMIEFILKRFGVGVQPAQILPTFGTREVLFNFPQFLLHDIENPVMAYTNPFYQIYEGAAIASRAEVIHINLTKENKFKPEISDEQLKKCDLVILNFPNNPTGATILMEELVEWVRKSIMFGFKLLNDECYSEIYFSGDDKPISLLQACVEAGNLAYKNCFVVNSISKRSSAPGLRSGFIAGDRDILRKYLQYRTYVGCAIPIPLQTAAATAWGAEKHVENFRKLYAENMRLAREILKIKRPLKATFYLWLPVENDLKFTQELYREKSIKVLPGRYLGRGGMGENYVRIALVETPDKIKKILQRLKDFMSTYEGDESQEEDYID